MFKGCIHSFCSRFAFLFFSKCWNEMNNKYFNCSLVFIIMIHVFPIFCILHSLHCVNASHLFLQCILFYFINYIILYLFNCFVRVSLQLRSEALAQMSRRAYCASEWIISHRGQIYWTDRAKTFPIDFCTKIGQYFTKSFSLWTQQNISLSGSFLFCWNICVVI